MCLCSWSGPAGRLVWVSDVSVWIWLQRLLWELSRVRCMYPCRRGGLSNARPAVLTVLCDTKTNFKCVTSLWWTLVVAVVWYGRELLSGRLLLLLLLLLYSIGLHLVSIGVLFGRIYGQIHRCSGRLYSMRVRSAKQLPDDCCCCSVVMVILSYYDAPLCFLRLTFSTTIRWRSDGCAIQSIDNKQRLQQRRRRPRRAARKSTLLDPVLYNETKERVRSGKDF